MPSSNPWMIPRSTVCLIVEVYHSSDSKSSGIWPDTGAFSSRPSARMIMVAACARLSEPVGFIFCPFASPRTIPVWLRTLRASICLPLEKRVPSGPLSKSASVPGSVCSSSASGSTVTK